MQDTKANTILMNESLFYENAKCKWVCLFKICCCDGGYQSLVEYMKEKCFNVVMWLGPEDDEHRMVYACAHMKEESIENFEIELRDICCFFDRKECEIGFCNVNYLGAVDNQIRMARMLFFAQRRAEFISKFRSALIHSVTHDLMLAFSKPKGDGFELYEVGGVVCKCGKCFKCYC